MIQNYLWLYGLVQSSSGALWLRQLISGFIHEWEDTIHAQISLIPPTLLQVCWGWGCSSLGSFMNGRRPYMHRSHWFLPSYSRCVVAEAAHLWVHSWMGGGHTCTDLIDSSHPTPGVLWLRQLISGFVHVSEDAMHARISLILQSSLVIMGSVISCVCFSVPWVIRLIMTSWHQLFPHHRLFVIWIHQSPVDSFHIGSVLCRFDIFFIVSLNKLLNKQ